MIDQKAIPHLSLIREITTPSSLNEMFRDEKEVDNNHLLGKSESAANVAFMAVSQASNKLLSSGVYTFIYF